MCAWSILAWHTLCVSVAFFVLVEWCVYCCGLLCVLSFLGICCDLVWSCCCFHVYISCEVVFLFCFHVLVAVHCRWRVFLCVFVLFEGLAGMVMCLVLACVFAVVSSNFRFFYVVVTLFACFAFLVLVVCMFAPSVCLICLL